MITRKLDITAEELMWEVLGYLHNESEEAVSQAGRVLWRLDAIDILKEVAKMLTKTAALKDQARSVLRELARLHDLACDLDPATPENEAYVARLMGVIDEAHDMIAARVAVLTAREEAGKC
jgi:hypothetical protein